MKISSLLLKENSFKVKFVALRQGFELHDGALRIITMSLPKLWSRPQGGRFYQILFPSQHQGHKLRAYLRVCRDLCHVCDTCNPRVGLLDS